VTLTRASRLGKALELPREAGRPGECMRDRVSAVGGVERTKLNMRGIDPIECGPICCFCLTPGAGSLVSVLSCLRW
jgi:hypothetical protein